MTKSYYETKTRILTPLFLACVIFGTVENKQIYSPQERAALDKVFYYNYLTALQCTVFAIQ